MDSWPELGVVFSLHARQVLEGPEDYAARYGGDDDVRRPKMVNSI
jgi:hypothetical protein